MHPSRSRRVAVAAVLSLALVVPVLLAAGVTVPFTFSNDTVADAAQVNANFQALTTAADGHATRLGTLENGRIGSTRASALTSCKALLTAGATKSGLYWIKPGTDPMLVYCEQELEGGGWTMVHNSVGSNTTMGFWRIPYAERFLSRGGPDLATNHYNGAIYQYGREYLDVFADLRGKEVVAMRATTTGINTTTMVFQSPVLVSGNNAHYAEQFAAGWSSFDYDGDTLSGNCAVNYNAVTQHYGNCWSTNLGSDAETSGGDLTDRSWGPHSASATALGLASDGSAYTGLQRITRFARW